MQHCRNEILELRGDSMSGFLRLIEYVGFSKYVGGTKSNMVPHLLVYTGCPIVGSARIPSSDDYGCHFIHAY